MSNAISKTVVVSPITIDDVYVGTYQKPGTKTLQLRQKVKTTASYPSKKASNEFSDNLFGAQDFGFENKEYANVENRVFFMNIPVNASEAQIKAKVAQANAQKAVLYRKMANKPILTDGQRHSISVGQKTMEDYADSQIVRHPDTKEVVLHNDLPQYRIVCFSETPKADEDFRGKGEVYYMAGMTGEAEVAENTDWSLSENDNLPF